jgi:hypothetical protein
MDPWIPIRIRIHTKMSRIRNTAAGCTEGERRRRRQQSVTCTVERTAKPAGTGACTAQCTESLQDGTVSAGKDTTF